MEYVPIYLQLIIIKHYQYAKYVNKYATTIL